MKTTGSVYPKEASPDFTSAAIKGRDFYDLLWFMQKKVWPLAEKLAKDGRQAYSVRSAMQLLEEKVAGMRVAELAVDLLPLFEQRTFIDAWLEGFHGNFAEYLKIFIRNGF